VIAQGWPRGRRTALGALLAIGATVVALVPAAHAGWTPADLATPEEPVRLWQPSVTIDRHGTTWVAALRDPFGSYFPGQTPGLEVVERRTDGTFGPRTLLTALDHTADAVQLASAADGSVYAAWMDRPDGQYGPVQIRVARHAPGASWFAESVAAAPTGAGAPAIAAGEDGTVALVWSRKDNGTKKVEAAFRDAGTGTWSAPVQVGVGFGPSVAVAPDGEVLVAWTRPAGDDSTDGSIANGIAVASRAPGAAAFGAPSDLFTGGDTLDAHAAFGPDGTATVVWDSRSYVFPGSVEQVSVATRSAGAHAFGPAEALSPPGASVDSPRLAVGADGTRAVAWNDGNLGSPIVALAIGKPGRAWKRSPDLGGTAGSRAPAVAVTSTGTTLAAWLSPSESKVLSTVVPLGGDPAPPTVRDEATGPDEYLIEESPALAVDGAGHAVGVWVRQHDLSPEDWLIIPAGRLRVAAFDEDPPTFAAVDVPGTAVAGTPIAMRASAPDPFSAVAVSWDFGDGTATTPGASASHAFTTPGDYMVTVTATDAAGNTTATSRPIRVVSPPPSPQPAPPAPPATSPLPAPPAATWPHVTARWHVRGTRTTLRRLSATKLQPGTRITLICTGRSCPFTTRALSPTNPTKNLLPAFSSHRTLAAGTRLELRLVSRHLSVTLRFALRRSHQPSRSEKRTIIG
jgi:PKD domain